MTSPFAITVANNYELSRIDLNSTGYPLNITSVNVAISPSEYYADAVLIPAPGFSQAVNYYVGDVPLVTDLFIPSMCTGIDCTILFEFANSPPPYPPDLEAVFNATSMQVTFGTTNPERDGQLWVSAVVFTLPPSYMCVLEFGYIAVNYTIINPQIVMAPIPPITYNFSSPTMTVTLPPLTNNKNITNDTKLTIFSDIANATTGGSFGGVVTSYNSTTNEITLYTDDPSQPMFNYMQVVAVFDYLPTKVFSFNFTIIIQTFTVIPVNPCANNVLSLIPEQGPLPANRIIYMVNQN